MRRFLIVFTAQGFGIGRIPVVPGTFGSVLGVAWLGLLLLTGNIWAFAALSIAAALACVYITDEAEKILDCRDPGSIVLDEIIAIPFCYLPWIYLLMKQMGEMPSLAQLFSSDRWLVAVGIFVLFRVFDMAKPYPIKRIQDLHGGWGVTLDDLAAAGYAAALQVGIYFLKPLAD